LTFATKNLFALEYWLIDEENDQQSTKLRSLTIFCKTPGLACSSMTSENMNEETQDETNLKEELATSTDFEAGSSSNPSTVNKKTRQCRYGEKCRRKDTCKFDHSVGNAVNSTERNKVPCRYGVNCYRKNCYYVHPPEWNPSNTNHNTNNRAKFSTPIKKSDNNPNNKSHSSTPHSSNSKPNSKSPRTNEVDNGFYCGPLRRQEKEGYKAAGILLLRQRDPAPPSHVPYFEASETSLGTSPGSPNSACRSTVQVLLCAEVRKKKTNSTGGDVEVNLLGGKIEDRDEGPEFTAAREFWEETGRISNLSECQRLVGIGDSSKGGGQDDPAKAAMAGGTSTPPNARHADKNITTVWCGSGKYVLYVSFPPSLSQEEQQQSSWDQLPLAYRELAIAEKLPPGAEPAHLVWVDWDLIRKRVQDKKLVDPVLFKVPSAAGIIDNGQQPESGETGLNSVSLSVPFSRFTKEILRHPTLLEAVDSAIQISKHPELSITQNPTSTEHQIPADGIDSLPASMEALKVTEK